MDVGTVIRDTEKGKLAPVYVIAGAERFLAERAVSCLRDAVASGGVPGFNDDTIHGGAASGQAIADMARTLPMMAERRFVLVRGAEALPAKDLDRLVDYLADPSPSTCLVLVADKLDGRSKFVKAAKKKGFFIDANPLKGGAVRAFARNETERRGHAMSADTADALLDAVGEELAALDDAIERLSLYVGSERPIDLAAVEACVARVRTESIWALVDAVSLRDLRKALTAAESMLAAREPPLRILAMLARQLRMVARMREALAAGTPPDEAAKAAGAPPFKARELGQAARRFKAVDLARAFATLAETDQALKGSKRPHGAILEEGIVRLCR